MTYADAALGDRPPRSLRRLLPTDAPLFELALPVVLAAATFAASIPWLRAYRVDGAVPLLALASILPVLVVVVVGSRARKPPAVSYAVSAVLFVVVLTASAGAHFSAVWSGIADGPNRLLTETLPLGGSTAVMGAAALVTWLCAAGSAELVVRARRDQNGLVAAGLALPLLSFLVAYAGAASAPGKGDVWVGAVLLGLVTAGAVIRHAAVESPARPSRRRLVASRGDSIADGMGHFGVGGDSGDGTGHSAGGTGHSAGGTGPSGWRRGALGLAVTVALAVALAVVVPALPGMSRAPDSLARPAQLATRSVVDPVDAMSALRDGGAKGPAKVALAVSINRPSPGYLAMAVLDDYDGAVWSFDATFQPTGGRLPALSPTAAPPGNGAVTQHVTVPGPLPIPLLPALDRPVAVSGIDAVSDTRTGMFMPGSKRATPFSYSVQSEAPTTGLAGIPAADGIDTAMPGTEASDTALPAGTSTAMATVLRFLSQLTGQRPAPTVAFLQSVLSVLHSDERRVDASLTPPRGRTPRRGTSAGRVAAPAVHETGTSLSAVINAVTIDRSATPEQFATLFAMSARYLGVPARVVTGFRIAPSSDGAPVPAGAYQVTDRQAWAWVEVPVAGLGWVVADPSPDVATAVAAPPSERVQVSATTLPPPQANAVPRGDILGGHALARPVAPGVGHSSGPPGWVIALLVLCAAAVAAAVAGPGVAACRRAVRRRARRSHDPARLAVGAWLELLDGLSRAGMGTPPGETSAEVALNAARHFGDEVRTPVQRVGDTADIALYSSASPDPGQAAAAWKAQRDVTRRVHGGLDRRQRVRAMVSVGSAPRRPEHRPRWDRAR